MDELNHIDDLFKDGLQNAQITPPPGVWEGIAAATSGAASTGAVTGITLAGKWIAAVVAIGAVGIAAYVFNDSNKADAPVPVVQSNSGESAGSEIKALPDVKMDDLSNPEVSTSNNFKNSREVKTVQKESSAQTVTPQAKQVEQQAGPMEIPVKKTNPKNTETQEIVFGSGTIPDCKHKLFIHAEKISNTAYSFSAINPVGMVTWSFGDGATQYGLNTSHQFANKPAEYTIKAYSSRLSPVCHDSAVYKIVVPGVKPILTNIFTPNGDGYNDHYFVEIQNTKLYELTILDLQNRVVFTSKNPDVHWDGTCSGISCPEGKYQVILTYQYPGELQPTVLREKLILTRTQK